MNRKGRPDIKERIRFLGGRIIHLAERHKTIRELAPIYIGRNITNKEILWLYYDTLLAKLSYGTSEEEYFYANFFRKNKFARMESFLSYYRFQFRLNLNKPDKAILFDNKIKLYEMFKEHLKREYIVVNKMLEYSTYESFIKKREGNPLFAKNPVGMGGKNVYKVHLTDKKTREEFYMKCLKEPMILEERLFQAKELREFNENTINTMRIITVIKNDGKAYVAYAAFRMGRGNMNVDNFSSGGIAAKINLVTGIVETAVDKQNKHYICHPDSGKQLIGYQIPRFDEYKEYALRLAMICPEVRYVGWDILMTEKGELCIIEGNASAGFDIQEATNDLNGLRPYYEKLMER